MARNPITALHSRTTWIFSISILLFLSLTLKDALAAGSCPQCTTADTLLKPCNSSLNMLSWPGTLEYQPEPGQEPCACNQNYYDQLAGCLRCESSGTAHYSVKELTGYKLVCQAAGQEWKQINIPTTTTTTTVPPTSVTTAISSSNAINTNWDKGGNGSHSNLSSGAIAGIIVSVIALVVALSVAGYVWNRRRKDIVREAGDLDEYKYHRDNQTDSYMEAALPQYTGMIQPILPPISKVSNLRVMNPDSDDEGASHSTPGAAPTPAPPAAPFAQPAKKNSSFEVRRTSSPGWRRGSFDDD